MFLIKFQEYFQKNVFGFRGLYSYKGNLFCFTVKKMFIEIGFKEVSPFLFSVTYIFKGHAKIDKIYTVKFNVTVLNRSRLIKFSEI